MLRYPHLAVCSAIALFLSTTALADNGTQVFGGYVAAPEGDGGYIGGLRALNNDMGSDGVVFRGMAEYSQYDYSTRTLGKVDADAGGGQLMAGYQMYLKDMNNSRVAFYIGGDYQDHRLNKSDTSNPVRGDEFGIIGMGHLRLNIDDRTYTNLIGSYSSAFDTYCASGRLGYRMGKFSIGPEVGFTGNEGFDGERLGLFIGDIQLIPNMDLNVSGGYEHVERRFSSGGFFTIGAGISF